MPAACSPGEAVPPNQTLVTSAECVFLLGPFPRGRDGVGRSWPEGSKGRAARRGPSEPSRPSLQGSGTTQEAARPLAGYPSRKLDLWDPGTAAGHSQGLHVHPDPRVLA